MLDFPLLIEPEQLHFFFFFSEFSHKILIGGGKK